MTDVFWGTFLKFSGRFFSSNFLWHGSFLVVFYDTFGRLLLKQENSCSPLNSLFLYLIVPFSFVRNSSFVKCYLTGGIITINENFIDNFSKVKFYCKSAQVVACFWIFTIKKCTLDGHFRYLFPSFALFNCLIIQSTWFPLLHAYVTQIRELLNKVEHISTFFHT